MREEIDDIENLILEEKLRNEQIANAQSRGSTSKFLKSALYSPPCWKSEEQSPKRTREDSQDSILHDNSDSTLLRSSDALFIDSEFYTARGDGTDLQTAYMGSMASWGNEVIASFIKSTSNYCTHIFRYR